MRISAGDLVLRQTEVLTLYPPRYLGAASGAAARRDRRPRYGNVTSHGVGWLGSDIKS